MTGNPVEVADDPVNHPSHYTSDPSGVECITVTRHRNFNVGNAMKYLWRAGLKDSAEPACRSKPQDEWCDRKGTGGFMGHTCGTNDKRIEDLKKARWYIADEIKRLGGTP